MNLREQIIRLALRKVSKEWYKSVGFTRAVDSLCASAFVEQWPESADTRALRKAAKLLLELGYVIGETPEVL